MPRVTYDMNTGKVTTSDVVNAWSSFGLIVTNLSTRGLYGSGFSAKLALRKDTALAVEGLSIVDNKIECVIDTRYRELVDRFNDGKTEITATVMLYRGASLVALIRFPLAKAVGDVANDPDVTVQMQLPGAPTIAALRYLDTSNALLYRDKVTILVEDVNQLFSFDREATSGVDDGINLVVPTKGLGIWRRVGYIAEEYEHNDEIEYVEGETSITVPLGEIEDGLYQFRLELGTDWLSHRLLVTAFGESASCASVGGFRSEGSEYISAFDLEEVVAVIDEAGVVSLQVPLPPAEVVPTLKIKAIK